MASSQRDVSIIDHLWTKDYELPASSCCRRSTWHVKVAGAGAWSEQQKRCTLPRRLHRSCKLRVGGWLPFCFHVGELPFCFDVGELFTTVLLTANLETGLMTHTALRNPPEGVFEGVFFVFLFFFLFFFIFFLFSKSPEHTHTPQTPTRTELAHSTRTKRTDPVYGLVSLSAIGDRCGAERWIALARQRASSVKPSMREFSRQMTAETWRS